MSNRNNFADLDTSNPSGKVVAVTPSDVTDLGLTRGVYVGGGGNLAVLPADDTGGAVTFTALAAGMIHPLRVQKILATGTTATGIVAVY